MEKDAYKELAMKDFQHLINVVTSSIFSPINHATKKFNSDLEESAVIDLLREKLENDLSTKTILKIHSVNTITLDFPRDMFSFFKSKKDIIVNISAIVDYYWTYGDKETSIPGILEESGIRKNIEQNFSLTYQEDKNDNIILIGYDDDNGWSLGKNNDSQGRPDLMMRYRENPSIIL